MPSEQAARRRDFVDRAFEAGAVAVQTQRFDGRYEHNPEAQLVLSTPTATYAVRQKYTSGWSFDFDRVKLAKFVGFCQGTELVPMVACRFGDDEWRCVRVTEATVGLLVDGSLRLQHKQLLADAAPLPAVARGGSPPPVEELSYVEGFHPYRIRLVDANAPAPEWADLYETQTGNVYYEVPPDRDYYLVTADSPDPLPVTAYETWTYPGDSPTHAAACSRRGVCQYLRNVGVMTGADGDDVSLREAYDRR